MEEAITALLLSHAPLQALVGDKINWLVRKQGTSGPYVMMQVITITGSQSYAKPDQLKNDRVQFDCWALTLANAKAIGAAVQKRLVGFRGSQGATYFDGIFLDSERHGYDAASTPDKLFRVSIDLLIWHKGAE